MTASQAVFSRDLRRVATWLHLQFDHTKLLTIYLGMTKIKHMRNSKTPDRLKPGPKPKPESQKVVKKTVSLQPATFEYLAKRGNGVLSHGIEAVVTENRSKKS